ncbi:MAG: TonB-dependent receptor [Acidobacteria bacterium]|nr:TonB-dependent receptor [Acidobacteriota bacterium]
MKTSVRAVLGFVTFMTIACSGLVSSAVYGQIKVGTVRGTVIDGTGGVLPGVSVTLANSVFDFKRQTVSANDGTFVFNNVPLDAYTLTLQYTGFQTLSRDVHVRSNVPVVIEDLKLAVGPLSTTIEVTSELKEFVEHDSTETHLDISSQYLANVPGSTPNRGMEAAIASATGVVTDDNGRLHVRGTESQLLYVQDGIPITERLDTTFASSTDIGALSSITVMTGNIPAEYGNRLGGVINIQTKSGIDLPLHGTVGASLGNFISGETDVRVGGKLGERLGFFLSSSASQSSRFLDPPDPGNFNNRGGTGKFNLNTDWHPTDRDILRINFSQNGIDFRVPNTREAEVAGQRARQILRDDAQSVMWQHLWSPNSVSNIALYRRFYRANLFCNEECRPLFSGSARQHSNQGLIGSVTYHRGRHNIKAGMELARLPVREAFSYYVTDPDQFEGTEAARAFTRQRPFLFSDSRLGRQFSLYWQDSFSPFENLTVDAGLRYDFYRLAVRGEQISPRIGGVYYIRPSKTALRAVYNRFFQPPQVEYLLLASSAQAAALSPFSAIALGGASLVQPDVQNFFEVGVSQALLGIFKLDVSHYWRRIHNFNDRDQFLTTAIIFPISVARGQVHGLDMRLDFPERKGLSGYVSFSNSLAVGIGPINGGLFLDESAGRIGPGTRFAVDHDQRNTGAFGITFRQPKPRWFITFSGRHESGVPFDFEASERAAVLRSLGADLVNIDRRRVNPRTLFNLSSGIDFLQTAHVTTSLQFDIQNLANARFLYNFRSIFSGTHFGYPRLYSGRLLFAFK